VFRLDKHQILRDSQMRQQSDRSRECRYLTLQRWWEEIFGWKPNPRSRWKRAGSNGLLWFATPDVIALLSL
jgi:hypothetical protein